MHNLKDLRTNLNIYKKKFQDRNVSFDIEIFKKKDTLNRDLISKKEKLEQEKKSLSKSKDQSNFEKSKKISQEIINLSKEQNKSQNELNKIIFSLPNIALEDVPVGKDETFNKLIKKKVILKIFHLRLNLILSLVLKMEILILKLQSNYLVQGL